MKKLISKIALTVMALITIIACFSLMACGDKNASNDNKNTSKYNGTYYGYLDGSYYTTSGMLLEGTYTLTLKDGKWTGSDDTGNKNFFDFAKSGEYEVKDNSITLHFQMGNIKMTLASGSVENNGFKFSIANGDVNYIYSFNMEESE